VSTENKKTTRRKKMKFDFWNNKKREIEKQGLAKIELAKQCVREIQQRRQDAEYAKSIEEAKDDIVSAQV